MSNHCIDCNKEIVKKATRCKSCAAKLRFKEKIDWPSDEELRARLEYTSWEALGRQLGVTSRAIRKRLLKY